ncbi:UvrD-helicase domain-containing protein [Halalkalibacter urbisdiaboli]|uniref:UvrD-helicase domain-containing protein n=1 Tax=Halalkalibacter urbisdiaboli TaxID=1960589 RepID=UPI000B432BE8|nr:ATP-dependent helicase [Halalkalibacter urbisdiaboli]
MQTAIHREKIIYLPKHERSEWQTLYTASIREEVTCMHCGEAVRLQLGIHQPPYFVHPPTTFDCVSIIDAYEKKMVQEKKKVRLDEPVSTEGFRLPKGRAIESNPAEDIYWKEPEMARAIPTFKPLTKTEAQNSERYRDILKDNGIYLDDSQWSAVKTTEGPLLLLAGAGSGKTRVLTARAAYMLTEKEIPEQEMILVTFTAKAAREMKERMKIYPGIHEKTLQRLMIGTFHSIFYKMLLHHEPDRWNGENLLKWDWQREQMIKEAGREIDLDEKEFAYDQALTQISWWKNHLLFPHHLKAKDVWEERVAYLYKRYEEMRLQKGMFDFDDMLIGCYEFLLNHPQLLKKYQQRFKYVSIDEFQDINKVQVELISMLTDKSRNLCVVGDDDQSIYAFRGSDPEYILHFNKTYPEAATIVLNQNYRSNHSIVSVANNVIASNRTRFPKQLEAQYASENIPFLFFPYDEEEEATMIITDIKEQIKAGATPSDFAILYRTNVTARALFERFVASNIPFVYDQDGESFYRRKTVRKVIAYLRLALQPDDIQAIKDLIGALFLKQTIIQDLKALSITMDCALVETLQHINGLQPFQVRKLKALPEQFKKLKVFTPEQAITFIEQEMGLKDYLKKQGNEGNKMDRGSDDVRDLKVAARQYQTIEDFLNHIDHIIAKQDELRRLPSTKEAVQLMTIHRSKGLEYKHVYILGGVEGSLPHDYALDAWREGDDKPLEEERRLMYVAMTRAQETLAISVPLMRRGKRVQRSRFVREMNRLAPQRAATLSTGGNDESKRNH